MLNCIDLTCMFMTHQTEVDAQCCRGHEASIIDNSQAITCLCYWKSKRDPAREQFTVTITHSNFI